MLDSIKRMCTPWDKSINEKLSCIREVFVKNMAESYANYYTVIGARGGKKRILIDRNMVIWPD